MRIFVADDDPVSLKLVRAALVNAGHSVESFTDGADLFEAFQKEPVAVVVTDWLMPRMSGIELARRIRAVPGASYTHVVIVTTLAPAEHATEAFKSGIDDYISKPIVPSDVVARVAAAERAMLRRQEMELRRSLETCQSALGPDHSALIDIVGDIASIYRRQEAWVRCRAFVRRQLSLAETANRTELVITLRKELLELEKLEDKRPLAGHLPATSIAPDAS